MKHEGEFLDLVQSALDERRDPREDERVQDAIIANPGQFEELERLLERLQGLRDPSRRSRLRPFALAATLVLLAALGLQRLASRGDRDGDPAARRNGTNVAAGHPSTPAAAVGAPGTGATETSSLGAGSLGAAATATGATDTSATTADLGGRVLSFEWQVATETPTEHRLTVITAQGTTTRIESVAAHGRFEPAFAIWTTESTRTWTP